MDLGQKLSLVLICSLMIWTYTLLQGEIYESKKIKEIAQFSFLILTVDISIFVYSFEEIKALNFNLVQSKSLYYWNQSPKI